MEKIKVTNEQVLQHIGEKVTLLNNILSRKGNWIGHILRRNCLLHDAIEEQTTEVKRVGIRRRTTTTQLLDDLRKRRRYWELKEEAEDRNKWKRQFINRT
jgi:hypothetical protein